MTQTKVWRAGNTVLLTLAMVFAVLPVFLVGALAPTLVDEFGISQAKFGLLVTAGLGAGAVLSLVIGPIVDALGARRSNMALFAMSTVTLALFAFAPDYLVLVAVMALGGVPQALANPATNRIIGQSVPAASRRIVLGIKQSGVQVGALAAGLPVAAMTQLSNWRVVVVIMAACAGIAAVASAWLPADPASVHGSRRRVKIGRTVWWLSAFSAMVGAGISAVSTYVVPYAVGQLRFEPQFASALVAALGVIGIGGRIGWSRVVAPDRPAALLSPLTAGAAVAASALVAAQYLGPEWVWVGAVGVGGLAALASAMSMIAVLAVSTPERIVRNSAVVSAGFFGGFALGPPSFGVVVEVDGYPFGWGLVALEFAVASVIARLALATKSASVAARSKPEPESELEPAPISEPFRFAEAPPPAPAGAETKDMSLAALSSAVGTTRRFVALTLREWGLHRHADVAEHLAVELVNRAVATTGAAARDPQWTRNERVGLINVRLRRIEHGGLAIEVWDSDPTAPPRDSTPDGPPPVPRVVQELSRRWDFYHPPAGGKIIWCELDLRIPPPPRPAQPQPERKPQPERTSRPEGTSRPKRQPRTVVREVAWPASTDKTDRVDSSTQDRWVATGSIDLTEPVDDDEGEADGIVPTYLLSDEPTHRVERGGSA